MTTHRLATTRTHLMRLLAGGAFLAMCAGQAAAEDTELTQQPFQISLGTFTNESDITIRADGDTTSGTEFDWGDTFGDVDGTKFRLDGYWRINDRHHVRFMYTENSAVNDRTLDRDYRMEWRNHSRQCLGPLGFRLLVFEVAYEYDFSKREDRELVLSAGLHYTAFSTPRSPAPTPRPAAVAAPRRWQRERRSERLCPSLARAACGTSAVTGGSTRRRSSSRSPSTTSTAASSTMRGAFIWQPKPWLGVGAGYDTFSIDVDVDRDRLDGSSTGRMRARRCSSTSLSENG